MTRFLIVLSVATLINSADRPQWLITAATLLLAGALVLEALLLVRAGRTARCQPLAAGLAGWYLAPELASGGVPVALPNLATLLWLAADPALVLHAPLQPLLVAQVGVLVTLALLLVALARSRLATALAGLVRLLRQPVRKPRLVTALDVSASNATSATPVDRRAEAAAGASSRSGLTEDEAVRALQSALVRIARLEAWRDEMLNGATAGHPRQAIARSMIPDPPGVSADVGSVYPPILPEGFEPDHHWHDGKATLWEPTPDPEEIDPRDLPPETTHAEQLALFAESRDAAFLESFSPGRKRT